MAIGQLHGNLHGGDDQAVPHQQQVCKTTCLWGSHLESVQRMLGYQLNHLEPWVNQAKKVALHKPTSLATAYFPRSVMRLPDVNQIMRTHIAVPCQIGINAGRGERQNWTTIISSGQFRWYQTRIHITPSMYCSLVKYLGFKYLCLFPFHLKLSINSSLIFFPHRTS